MRKRIQHFSAIWLSFALVFCSFAALPVEISLAADARSSLQQDFGWNLNKSDWIIVNVEHNTLQFVRGDLSKTSQTLQIGSGRLDGHMNYLGMRYLPATPEKVWEIRSKNQQNWCNVFCNPERDDQLFLRLYEIKGKQRIYSHYGFHSVPNIEELLETNDGYNSWGCVLTRYDLLKFIEQLYELNEGVIRVVTTKQSTRTVISLVSNF